MKKITLLLFVLSFWGSPLSAQITYEPGYYIDKNGNQEEVLILNKDWRYSPSSFSYKHTADGEVQTGNIKGITEFGVGDYLRYRSFLAPIDHSGERINKMSTNSEPEFKHERVFLRQLIAGKANLYIYSEGGLERYFYSLDGGELEPLVYKKYRKDNKIAVNGRFRQQLFSELNCGNLPAGDFKQIAYTGKDLQDYFIGYNECEGADYYEIREERKGVEFNLYLKAGIDHYELSILSGMNAGGANVDLDPGLRFGAEAEFIMPFNRNKWALFGEALYGRHQLKDEHIQSGFPTAPTETWLSMDLQFVSLAGGIRHYLFLNQTSKLFINAAITFDVPIKSEVVFDRGDSYELDAELDDASTDAYINLGVGYNYSNRLSAELRYSFPKVTHGRNEVPTHYKLLWEAEISTVSLILAYRMF